MNTLNNNFKNWLNANKEKLENWLNKHSISEEFAEELANWFETNNAKDTASTTYAINSSYRASFESKNVLAIVAETSSLGFFQACQAMERDFRQLCQGHDKKLNSKKLEAAEKFLCAYVASSWKQRESHTEQTKEEEAKKPSKEVTPEKPSKEVTPEKPSKEVTPDKKHKWPSSYFHHKPVHER